MIPLQIYQELVSSKENNLSQTNLRLRCSIKYIDILLRLISVQVQQNLQTGTEIGNRPIWPMSIFAPFLPNFTPFFQSEFIVQSRTYLLPNLTPFLSNFTPFLMTTFCPIPHLFFCPILHRKLPPVQQLLSPLC